MDTSDLTGLSKRFLNLIKQNDIEINKVKETDGSVGLYLVSGCCCFLTAFIRKEDEKEKKWRRGRGDETRE